MDRAATSPDTRRWLEIFERRAMHSLPVISVPPGARDRTPEVVNFLRMAAYCEDRALDVLMQKSREARDPETARCLAYHAQEDALHGHLLQAVVDGQRPLAPPGAIGAAERFITRNRSLEEQVVVSLVTEALAVTFYRMVARALEPGRAAEALRVIADDEFGHRDFLAALLVKILLTLPPREVRRLRRLRNRTIAILLLVHALLHRKYLRPLLGLPASAVRRTLLAEIERSLSTVPDMAIPTLAS